MKRQKLGILLIILVSTSLAFSSSTSATQTVQRNKKSVPFLNSEYVWGIDKSFSSREDEDPSDSPKEEKPMDNNDAAADEPSSNSQDSSKATTTTIHLPQINFYSSIPNSVGVITNGLLWLRELSAAMGTPLPIFIGAVPMVVFGFLLMFVPDLTVLGLPLFYPNGAEGDPLAAFPPVPEFSMEDLTDLSAIKTAFKQFFLIPPDWF